jgi:DNA-binding NtrC family response regulator
MEDLDLYKNLEYTEQAILERALELSGGDKSKAARLCNINRTTLVEKLKRMHNVNPSIREMRDCIESLVVLYELHESELYKIETLILALEKQLKK